MVERAVTTTGLREQEKHEPGEMELVVNLNIVAIYFIATVNSPDPKEINGKDYITTITANTKGVVAQGKYFIGSNEWYYLIFESKTIATYKIHKIILRIEKFWNSNQLNKQST